MASFDHKFMSDLLREDDVGLVVLGHLHIEHQLIELISCVLPFPDRCEWGKLSYRAKVSLAHSCGLPEKLRGTLHSFGSLRNDFAHQLDAAISKECVLGIYNALPDLHREVVKNTYKEMGFGSMTAPASLLPRDLLVLLFLNIRQAVKAAVQATRGAP